MVLLLFLGVYVLSTCPEQEDLCSYHHNQTLFFPSWCQWDHPFQTVMPMWEIDSLIDTSGCLAPPCGPPAVKQCDPASLADCAPVTAIASLELTSDQTDLVLAVVGLESGSIFATYGDLQKMTTQQQVAFSFDAHPGYKVAFLESYANASDGYLLSSDSHSTKLWKISLSSQNPLRVSRVLCYSERSEILIDQITVVALENNPIIYFGWMTQQGLKVQMMDTSVITTEDQCGLLLPNLRTWNFEFPFQPVPVLSMSVVFQWAGSFEDRWYQTLILVATTASVHVFEFFGQEANVTLGVDDANTLYHVGRQSHFSSQGLILTRQGGFVNHTLTAAQLFGEDFRVDSQNSTGTQQRLWLVVGIAPWTITSMPSPTVDDLDIRDLPDANNFTYYLSLIELPELFNLSARVLPLNGFGNTHWCSNTTSCQPRARTGEQFLSPVKQILARSLLPNFVSMDNRVPFANITQLFCEAHTIISGSTEWDMQPPFRVLVTNLFVTLASVSGSAVSLPYGQLRVFSFQTLLHTDHEFLFSKSTNMEFTGKVLSVHITPNFQHVMVVISRTEFEVAAQQRMVEICAILAVNKSDPYLQDYLPVCGGAFTPQVQSLADFVWTLSACPPPLFCPHFWTPEMRGMASPGYYSLRGFDRLPCEPGYFCSQGVRQQCPPGFYCPFPTMTAPIKCRFTVIDRKTCFHSLPSYSPGLVRPVNCSDGELCNVPYLPGGAAPPGHAVDLGESPRQFVPCKIGEWCALARSFNSKIINSSDSLTVSAAPRSSLLCPAMSFCSHPEVVRPNECTPVLSPSGVPVTVFYCPPGTVNKTKCPAGFYCSLDHAEAKPCEKNFYCPEGSWDQLMCPAGYRCRTPKELELCPKGYFCALGMPPQRCSIFTVCGEGTSSHVQDISSPLIIVFSFLGPFVLWHLFLRHRNKQRQLRHLQRETERRSLIEESQIASEAGQFTAASPSSKKMGQFVALEELGANDLEEEKIFPLDIHFQDLSFTLDDKVLLKEVSGEFLSGEITAVMGPSGCGKSTLLNVLLGKQPGAGTRNGKVTVNGQETTLASLRKFVGFVPQSDVMHNELTVKENLTYSAVMRLPKTMSARSKSKVVNRVLMEIGLFGKRHDRVGDDVKRGISGGQKKKVSIGIELVALPSVLFLDEPTSGLDSSTSQSLVNTLHKLAKTREVNIIAVIHQPRFEIFQAFDKVVLLGTHRVTSPNEFTQGRLVYFGPTSHIVEYFTTIGCSVPPNTNPADFFLDMQEHRPAAELADLWLEKGQFIRDMCKRQTPRHRDALPSPRATENPLVQTLYFTKRAFLQQTRFWWSLIFDILLSILAGFFLGVINFDTPYIGPGDGSAQAIARCEQSMGMGSQICRMPRSDPILGQASIACISLALLATAGSVRIFGAERVVFWRESSTGVNTMAYYVGKSVGHLPSLLGCALFLVFFSQLAQPRAPGAEYYGLCILIYWTATGYGYLVSILAPANALLLGVLSVLVNMMFSGANPRFFQLRQVLGAAGLLPTYLSYIRWVQEAWYLIEIAQYRSQYDVEGGMEYMEYHAADLSTCLWATFLIGCIVRGLAFVALEFMYREKRR